MVVEVPFAFAFTAGMVATVNPCGFAMLPAYLSYFVGADDDDRSLDRALVTALRTGVTMTLGFVVVFGIAGLIATAGVRSAQSAFNVWAARGTIVIGLVLAVMGVAMLFFGFTPTLRLPRFDRGGDSDDLGSILLFGISFAVVSLSCAVPVFLSLIAVTSDVNLASAVVGFGVYALGMGALVTLLTLALAVGKQGLVHRLRSAMPYVHRVTGAIVLVAGLWVAWNRWVFLRDSTANPALLDRGDRLSAEVQRWIEDFGTARIGLIAAAVILVTLAFAVGRSRWLRTADVRDSASERLR